MIFLKTLEHSTLEDITGAFNHAFSDYIVPFKLTPSQLNDRIGSEGIQTRLSVGAFEDNKLIGFILHGYDVSEGVKTAYNGGTGVIPDKRGNHLTSGMYEFSLPILQNLDIARVQLEVITQNIPAFRTYKKIGFEVTRKLDCYKGPANVRKNHLQAEIKHMDAYDWHTLQSFWDWNPAWSNSIKAVEYLRQTNISIGIYTEGNISGYLIFNPNSRRIQQFAIDKKHRNKGLGKQLFNYIIERYGNEISLINIHARFESATKFLTGMGLFNHLSQYEMELRFSQL